MIVTGAGKKSQGRVASESEGSELPPRVKEVSVKQVGEQGASERLREWAACAIE
jgi:hypothetical protein